jgi:hypothetical protein
MKRRAFVYGAGATAVAAVVGWQLWPARAAAPVTTDAIGDKVQTLPKGQVPMFAETGDTARLYRYAVEHGDELQYIPCTCGCERFGHKSNRDCYVKSFNGDGTLTFTSHAAT